MIKVNTDNIEIEYIRNDAVRFSLRINGAILSTDELIQALEVVKAMNYINKPKP